MRPVDPIGYAYNRNLLRSQPLCAAGIYSMFLWWAIAQERLYVPFQSIDGKASDKFRSALFLGTCQSFLSSLLSALIYILLRKKKSETLIQALGFHDKNSEEATTAAISNGKAHTIPQWC
ncbi:hypothetical protein F5890DRAFT_1532414, partial [Lentinula detonsa]